jgi:hypothetical protein
MDPSESRGAQGKAREAREKAWEMTPGEKVMAQWEAQHDVAARGHRCDPLGVQHQLSRARVAERVHAAPPRATGSTAAGSAAGGRSATGGTTTAPRSGAAASPPAPADEGHAHEAQVGEARVGEARVDEARADDAPTQRRHPWLHRLTRHGGRP